MTGDEIMNGDTIDTNSSFFCQELSQIGLKVEQIITCGDNLNLMVKTINQIANWADILIMNGGLGPTEDDYTYQALALATNQKLIINKIAEKSLHDWLKKRGFSNNKANLKQVYLPEKAKPIINKLGSAPGALVKLSDCSIYCTPGVSSEMFAMWRDTIKKQICDTVNINEGLTLKLRSFGLGESLLQMAIAKAGISSNQHYQLGFRANFPYVDCKLTALSSAKHTILKQAGSKLKKVLADYYVSDNEQELEKLLLNYLLANKQTISVAESVSGGMLSSLLTKFSGASSVFRYGIVCYSNEAKQKLLQIPPEIINQYGAISKQTAQQMLSGIVNISKPDYALVTTGFAGPKDPASQIGKVFIGCYSKINGSFIRECQFSGDRKRIKSLASHTALDCIRRVIFNLPQNPAYSFDRSNMIKELK